MPTAELTPKQQLNELVKNSQSILVVTHHNPDGDALGSALAMKMGLEKLGKEVTVVATGELHEPLSFLPHFDILRKEINLQKDLLIVLDESQAKIGNISLKRISDTKLIVVVTPKNGTLTPTNVRVEEGSFNVDLIICVDCANLDRVGPLYEENSNLFYEVPVVNIDHHASNTNFGKVNIVDITASSTSEILVALLEMLGKEVEGMLDSDIATCLLTGITTDTGSFQNSNTTPKSLTVAAQLVAAGGRQQDIIKHIFRTRSLSTLRLWGRALSYIKEDSTLKFAWSTLSKADFVAAQANQEESSGVIDELLKTAQGMDFVVLLTERDNGVHGSFRSINPSTDVSQLASLFAGGGHPQAAAFFLPGVTLKEKEQELIKKLRDHLSGPVAQPDKKEARVAHTVKKNARVEEMVTDLQVPSDQV
jgi:phosphoesterase RecJ-like protein